MFAIDHQHRPSHVMTRGTKTQSAPMWGWLDQLGSQVRNSYDSFVVRAPKTTLLSTKTVSANASTSTPATHLPHISVPRSSLAISFELSAPTCSCATARDQLTNDSTRRLIPLHPIAAEEDSGKIPVRAATVALRRAVRFEPTQESTAATRTEDAGITLSHARSRRLPLPSSSKAVGQAAAFVAQRRSSA
ncbi:hypothetical protein T484DRAFT_1842361 [Baffinella frigidus]|nr:hypothetical protein T484DRAFT_1842361 [Cryptophyta sp. CCMP2293]